MTDYLHYEVDLFHECMAHIAAEQVVSLPVKTTAEWVSETVCTNDRLLAVIWFEDSKEKRRSGTSVLA